MTTSQTKSELDLIGEHVQQSWSHFHLLEKYLQRIPDETLVRLAASWRNKVIVDMGCGGGRHTAYLSSLGNEVWGLDYVEIPHFQGVNFAKLDLSDVNALVEFCNEKKVDSIVAIQIFDHLPIGVAEELLGAIASSTNVSEIVLSFFTDQCQGVVREKWVEGYGWLASLGSDPHDLHELHNFFPSDFFSEIVAANNFSVDKRIGVYISESEYTLDTVYLRIRRGGISETIS